MNLAADTLQLPRINLLLLLPLLLRPTCGTTTRRWWRGWRGSWPKTRAPGPSSTRTSSTSDEITSSSRSAGSFSQRSTTARAVVSQCSGHQTHTVVILFPLQPRPGQSGGRHGLHRTHDPAHLGHAENRGGAHPVHHGVLGLLLGGEPGPSTLRLHLQDDASGATRRSETMEELTRGTRSPPSHR